MWLIISSVFLSCPKQRFLLRSNFFISPDFNTLEKLEPWKPRSNCQAPRLRAKVATQTRVTRACQWCHSTTSRSSGQFNAVGAKGHFGFKSRFFNIKIVWMSFDLRWPKDETFRSVTHALFLTSHLEVMISHRRCPEWHNSSCSGSI